ncbi:MAG: SH3 domain-containing protein, partial [Treponema sp.]|nr:SH3 domain-containing protein [Treponema sp.]
FLYICIFLLSSYIYSDDVITLEDSVSEEMLSPKYWIKLDSNSEEIKMTKEEINAWNLKSYSTIYDMGHYNLPIITDLVAVGKEYPKDLIYDFLLKNNLDSPLYVKKNGEVTELSKKDWKVLWANMNGFKYGKKYEVKNKDRFTRKKIGKETVPCLRAIAVDRAYLRELPSNEFYSNDVEYWYDDFIQGARLLIGEPVLVLEESLDKEWYFVKTLYSSGWVEAKYIAFCSDEIFEKTFNALNDSFTDVCVITSDKACIPAEYIYLPDEDEKDKYSVKDITLSMGTKLFFHSWNDKAFASSFYQRKPFASYAVEIPYKKSDGNVGFLYAAIPASFCHRGVVDFTSENIIRLAFQSLGSRYGWGYMADARDCSGLVMDLFRCFGFCFPRTAILQIHTPGETIDIESLSGTKKEKAFEKAKPGSLVYMSGHIAIYLGEVNDKLYVISAAGNYYGTTEEDERIDVNSVTVNTLAGVRRKNGKTWFENAVCIKLF